MSRRRGLPKAKYAVLQGAWTRVRAKEVGVKVIDYLLDCGHRVKTDQYFSVGERFQCRKCTMEFKI